MIYSPAHKCVLYTVPDPQRIAAAIPQAKQVNGAMVAIPTDLFSLQLARVLGLPAPPLMDIEGYDWPMEPGKRPYEHQRHMANFHALHPRAYNLSEMGTGKTNAVLWAADYLMRQGAIHKVLILSPLSTLKRVWEDEIFRNFMGRRSAVILHGERWRRIEILKRAKADFYILNHDGLGIGSKRGFRGLELGELAKTLMAREDIDCVVIDEASAYKDGATLRSRILRFVVERKPYIWLLSGTPTPNAPTDAWSLSRLTGKTTDTFRAFRDRTMVQLSQFKWIPRNNATAIVNAALQPAIRYSREECIDLPECVVETRDVPLSSTQEAAYKTLKKDLVLTMKSGDRITAVNEAVLRLKLIQVACGAIYGVDREVHRTDCGPRIEETINVIDEAGGKILIFLPFTSIVNLLYSELKGRYGDAAVARVYGATAQGQRNEIFRAFEQEANPRIICADPGTMSHGLTLVAANTIIWFGPTDRPEIYEQANARINRPGQKRKMLVVRLASTPVEREIYRRLAEKAGLQGAILKLVEEGR